MQPQQQPQKPTQSIIMLPSRHIPQILTSQIADLKDFSIRFINGYRNIIQVSSDSQPEWGLTPNQDYCGQAFCYLLKSTVNKEELTKKDVGSGHVIYPLSDEMLVVQSTAGFTPNNIELSPQHLNKLIDQVAESKQIHKLSINLIKNAFDSFQAYQKSMAQSVQKIEQQLKSQQEQKIPTVTESLALEQNVKKLQGEMIKKLPKCNRETGMWDDDQTIEIKLNTE